MPTILQQRPPKWNQIYKNADLQIDVYIATADQFQQNNSPDALYTQVRVTALNNQISLDSLTLTAVLHNNPPQVNTTNNFGFVVTLDPNQSDFKPNSSTKDFAVKKNVPPGAGSAWVSDQFPTWIKRNWDGATADLAFYISNLNYSVYNNQSGMTDPNPNSSTTQLF